MSDIQIRDIPKLQDSIKIVDNLVRSIIQGPFNYAYGVVNTSLSIGYNTQIMDMSYTLDVNGTIQVLGNSYLSSNVYVKKDLYVSGDVKYNTMNGSSIKNTGMITVTTLLVNDYQPPPGDNGKPSAIVRGESTFNVSTLFNRSINVSSPCVIKIGNNQQSIRCDSNTNGSTRFDGTIDGNISIGSTGNTFFDLSASTYSNKGIVYSGPVELLGSYDLKIGGNLNVTGNVISYSDKKLKDNITKLESCLEKINFVNGYRYNRNDLDGEAQIGLIAQEIEINFPELVFEKNEFKSINYSSFIAVLLQCIKELKDKIDILENKILI
jgi:hypothetical protein